MKKELDFCTKLSRTDAADVIAALTEGLKEGQLKLRKKDQHLELDVAPMVDLEVEGRARYGRATLKVEVSWWTDAAVVDDDGEQEPEDVEIMEMVAMKAKETVLAAAKEASDALRGAVKAAKTAVHKGKDAVKTTADQARTKVESALGDHALKAKKSTPAKPEAKKAPAKPAAKSAPAKTQAKKPAPKKGASKAKLIPKKTEPAKPAAKPAANSAAKPAAPAAKPATTPAAPAAKPAAKPVAKAAGKKPKAAPKKKPAAKKAEGNKG